MKIGSGIDDSENNINNESEDNANCKEGMPVIQMILV